jgi:hypothetical protein
MKTDSTWRRMYTTIFVLLAVVRDKAKATPDSTLCREIGFTEDQITRAYRFFERKIRPSEILDLEKVHADYRGSTCLGQ